MKVVVDTNVLISAALRDQLPEKVLEAVIKHDDWEWVLTPALLGEYAEVIRRPRLRLEPVVQERWLALVRDHSVMVETSPPEIEFIRDRRDILVLQAAIVGAADYLITGDKDFADAQALIPSRIMSPQGFARLQGIV